MVGPSIEVLVVIDDANKIYYTEDINFAANDREGIQQAQQDYFNLVVRAQKNGYQIIKREKSITTVDEGLMPEGDKRKKIIEKLDDIKTMLPKAVNKAIENGKNPDECYDIYNQITQLLTEIKSEVESADLNLTDENKLNGPKF